MKIASRFDNNKAIIETSSQYTTYHGIRIRNNERVLQRAAMVSLKYPYNVVHCRHKFYSTTFVGPKRPWSVCQTCWLLSQQDYDPNQGCVEPITYFISYAQWIIGMRRAYVACTNRVGRSADSERESTRKQLLLSIPHFISMQTMPCWQLVMCGDIDFFWREELLDDSQLVYKWDLSLLRI